MRTRVRPTFRFFVVYKFRGREREHGSTSRRGPEHRHRLFHTIHFRHCSNDLNSKFVAEDVENILRLALVLRVTEALHGLAQLRLNIRAHLGEVGLNGGVLI